MTATAKPGLAGAAPGTEVEHPAGSAEVARAVFDQMPMVALAVSGPQQVYVVANAALRAFLMGRNIIGLPLLEAFPEVAGQRIVEAIQRVYTTGQPVLVPEWRFNVDWDGSGTLHEVFFDLTLSPLRENGDDITGAIVLLVDATDRVRQRQQVQRDADASEQRYAAALDVVTQLQQALLPTALPVLPGAEVAARYLVAAKDQSAGGDWFDAIPLPDGTVGLVIGDIVGHGVAASAAMGQLRSVLGRALVETGDLQQAIGWADRLAADSPTMRAATLCVAVLDPVSGDVRYSTCGHPPPLLITEDGVATQLPGSGGGPLGTSSTIQIATAVLPKGAVLMLYSDGLIERPGELISVRMDALARVAGDAVANRALPLGAPRSAAERATQQCVEIMTREGYDDDVTVLAARRRREPVPAWRREAPATASELNSLRDDLSQWLSRCGASEPDRRAIDLTVTELAANVIEHAYAESVTGPLRVRGQLAADGVLVVEVADDGHWRVPGPPAATSGRGLWLAGAVVDQLTVRHEEHRSPQPTGSEPPRGTVVTARKRLAHPAQLGPQPAAATDEAERMEFATDLDPGPPPVLRVRGPIDIATAATFADQLDVATRGGTQPVIINLDGVEILASAGIRVLITHRDHLATHGHSLDITAADDTPAQQVLELVGIDHH